MSRISKLFISLFILFNFLVMLRIHLPIQTKFFSTIYRPIDSYLSFFTLFQSWNMFAPNPSRTNVYLTAEVEFEDGGSEIFEFPRVDRMNIFEKYTYGERMRVLTESIRVDKNKFLWKDASKFALRKLGEKNFNRIPKRVHLYRHWNITPDPKRDYRFHLTKSQDFESFKFYTYEVL